MLCPTLAAHSSLFAPSQTEYWYSHLAVWSAGQPGGWREVEVASHHKTIFSSTAVFLRCLKKKLLHTLRTFKCFNNEFFDFNFRFYSTWWCTHVMKHFILKIILSFEIKFLSIVIFYLHVVLHQQISSFTITEIYFRISNLQHVNENYNFPPWIIILFKHSKLMKHQLHLRQKKIKIKRFFLFSISISSNDS